VFSRRASLARRKKCPRIHWMKRRRRRRRRRRRKRRVVKCKLRKLVSERCVMLYTYLYIYIYLRINICVYVYVDIHIFGCM